MRGLGVLRAGEAVLVIKSLPCSSAPPCSALQFEAKVKALQIHFPLPAGSPLGPTSGSTERTLEGLRREWPSAGLLFLSPSHWQTPSCFPDPQTSLPVSCRGDSTTRQQSGLKAPLPRLCPACATALHGGPAPRLRPPLPAGRFW